MKKHQTIRALIYAPGAANGIDVRIERHLKNFQSVVQGLIACPSSGREGVDCIVNDEGILLSLPVNRFVPSVEQWIHGPMILARENEETGEYVDLTDDDVRWARGQFDTEVFRERK